MRQRKGIIYIDPQSYRNLSIYDYSLLTELCQLTSEPVTFFGSSSYDYLPPPSSIDFQAVFSYNRKKSSVAKALSYLWSYLRIIAFIIKARPRVIHFQWFKLTAFDRRFLWLLKRLSAIRTVHTAHNLLPHDTGDRYRADYNHIYHTVDHIIVHTQDTRQQLLSQFGISADKVSVIPHGLLRLSVDEQLLTQKTPRYEARYQTAGRTVFIALGEQTPYKGIDLLADVWRSTPELSNNPQLRLIIVGRFADGLDLTTLSQCPNAVVCNGRIPDDEFYYLLHHASIYLLPYRRISQSGALLTAMAEQVPVLVSQVGGLCDPLAIANVGWTVRPNDPDDLRRQLLAIANHPEEAQRIKADSQAWQKIAHHYSWQHIAQLTAQVYAPHIL